MRFALIRMTTACLLFAGCDDQAARRDRERRELLSERQQLQAVLDQNKTPPAQLTPAQLAYYGQIDQQIRGINQRLDQLNYQHFDLP